MEKNKIIIVSTPSSKESEFSKEFKKYFKNIEIKEIKLDEIINGYNADIIEIDSMSCRDKVGYKTCGDCEYFGELSEQQSESLNGKKFGCKTSFIEAKYGNKNTPACAEFKKKRVDATLKIAGTN